MKDIICKYIENINKIFSTSKTTEHSFRGDFKELCETILNEGNQNNSEYTLINEPKRKTYGAPDYELLKSDTTIAFIEAKQIGDSDLRGTKDKKHKKQFDKYKEAISTIAFTDYLTIILYENGEEILTSCIGKVSDGNIIFNDDDTQIANFEKIIHRLGKAEPQPIRSATVLADKMARKAKIVAAILQNAMNMDEKERTQDDEELWGKLRTFKKFLVHDMTESQFVDFYSQTILYGLFIARINDKTPETFSLSEAAELIPSINPFLKKKTAALISHKPPLLGTNMYC